MIAATQFFTVDQVPANKERGLNNSVEVLIDLDGRRREFAVGWFDLDQCRCYCYGEYRVDQDNMKWTLLPLRRLDNGKAKVKPRPAMK